MLHQSLLKPHLGPCTASARAKQVLVQTCLDMAEISQFLDLLACQATDKLKAVPILLAEWLAMVTLLPPRKALAVVDFHRKAASKADMALKDTET